MLGEHILRLWHDTALHNDYAQRGLQRAQLFSWARAARETLKIYTQ
jgi:hypothetical protein